MNPSLSRKVSSVFVFLTLVALVATACTPQGASGVSVTSTTAPAATLAPAVTDTPAATTAPTAMATAVMTATTAASSGSGSGSAAASGPIAISSNDKLGKFLVASNGMTLYTFAKDTPGASNCTGGCLQAWPALLVPSGQTPTAGDGITGTLATVQRSDGTGTQVTYNGLPLYFFVKDKAPGDTTGQGVGKVWAVARPAMTVLTLAANAIKNPNTAVGPFLVAPNGMTLYTFAKDTPGVSNCTGGCLQAWPPLVLKDGDALTAGAGVNGALATITRSDNGQKQVTYNGMPVYFYIKDKAPGDTTGQGVGGVWTVAAP